MRVRDIPKSSRSLTGVYYLLGGEEPPEHESALERDLITLTILDPRIKQVHSQPVEAKYLEEDGKGHTILDFFVEFHPCVSELNTLVNVKYREDLRKQAEEVRPKIRAGLKYAKENKCRHQVLTDVEIRTPFLRNAQFLAHTLQDGKPGSERIAQLLDALEEVGECTINDLLDGLGAEAWADWFPTLLHLIAGMKIWVDLGQPLTLDSMVRPQLEPDPRFLWGPHGPPLIREAQMAAHLKRAQEAKLLPVTRQVRIIDPSIGAQVFFKGHACTVLKAYGENSVQVRENETGAIDAVAINDLSPVGIDGVAPKVEPDIQMISEKDWDSALRKVEIIRPLLGRRKSFAEVQRFAGMAGVNPYTIYDWIRMYEAAGRKVTAFLPHQPTGGKGKGRIANEGMEKMIAEVIEDTYLVKERPKVSHAFEELTFRCHAAGLPKPSRSTFYNRIAWIPKDVALRRRYGNAEADQATRVDRAGYEEALHPYHILEFDHTQSDLFVIDPLTGLVIGRPWVTLAIDVYSRMIVGVEVSMDPPSAMSVGLCLSKAILSKKAWLGRLGITREWPGEGLPVMGYADNGSDMRSETIRRQCQQYRVNLQWRPVLKPHFGGHIERLVGTAMHNLQKLPGTSFSSVAKRAKYDSAGNAILSIDEFETWLAEWISGVYHQRPHMGLGGQCPIQRYKEGIEGVRGRLRGHLGCGPRPRIMDADAERFRMDFLPGTIRVVRQDGVVWDHVHYVAPEFAELRRRRDPRRPDQPMGFMVRRDPRDISILYLYDAQFNKYIRLQYRDKKMPVMSVWELRAAKAEIRKEFKGQINEDMIFNALKRLREIQEKASTRKVRTNRKGFNRRRHEELDVHGKAEQKAVVQEEAGASKIVTFQALETNVDAPKLNVPKEGWWG